MSFNSLRNSDETAKYASRRRLFTYLTISCFILLVHGFHYGVEDDAIYLPAVKKSLNPSLYPHDARFFSAQTNLTVFPAVMALLSRISHLPVHWTFLIVYCATVFLFVVVLR